MRCWLDRLVDVCLSVVFVSNILAFKSLEIIIHLNS